jgi:eukaryotic-like serine/threonine-protein kinase
VNVHGNAVREKQIFEEALNLTSPVERLAFVRGACGRNETLLARVQALLEAHETAEGFLPGQPADQPLIAPLIEKPGDRIGRYKLLQKIGEGGMGVVYMAEQEEPIRRRVALKIIKLGMDTQQVVARFEAERQALALMDHPNIAKVFDAGATDTGRPYFVMELVTGIPITEFCDKNRLGAVDRINLFIQVCHAIQSAHQKGIIHRDLKPTNILVTLNAGAPVPIVIDFGVAKATQQKLTEKTFFTNYATMIGTPAYMSPEQAEMSQLDVDTRSDIYGLGVLLYELLTGTTPFMEKRLRSVSYNEMQRIIMEEEPERPSTRLTQELVAAEVTRRRFGDVEKSASSRQRLQEALHQIKGDLDWIVMKCLEKDRMRRYDTANGVAADLKRHLENEPVLARPPSAAYKFQKAFRRNKLAFCAAAAVTAALVIGLSLTSWMFFKERDARRRATAAEQTARDKTETANENLYVSDMNVAKLAWDAGDLGRATELLDRHRREAGRPDYRGFEWRYLWNLCRPTERATLAGRAGPLNGMAISSDGNILATASSDKTVKLWDLTSRREVATLTGHLDSVTCAAFSPDGKTLATGSADNTVILWDVASRKRLGLLAGHSSEVNFVGFSPGGKILVSASTDQSAKLWDLQTLQVKHTLLRYSNVVRSAAFSPDGRTLVTGGGDGTVKLWDPSTGREAGSLDAHQLIVWSLAFSPDGGTLAMGLDDGSVGVWDLTARREIHSLTGHRSVATCVQFSPDGQTLASGSLDDTIRLWSTHTWGEKGVLRGHLASVSAVAFTPDSRTVLSSSFDKTVKIWDANPPQMVSSVQAHASWCTAEPSPDGKIIASTSTDGTIKLWDALSLANLATLKGGGGRLIAYSKFSSDGRLLASASADNTIKLWDVRSRKEVATLSGHSNNIWQVGFLAGGRTLVSCSADKTIKFWDLDSCRQIASLDLGSGVECLAVSGDGKWLASGCEDGSVSVFDASSRVRKFSAREHDKACWALAFSPDSKFLATGAWDGTVKLWDTRMETAVILKVPVANDIAFSPDGKTLVIGSADKTIRFWNLATMQEVLALQAHLTGVTSVRFSPRGDFLLTAGVDGKVSLWPAPTFGEIDAIESRNVK